MRRKNGHTFPADEEAAMALSAGLSRVVKSLLVYTHYTQSSLAQAMGYSRITLNQVLKSTDGRYLWRLPMLCAASRVLGLPVHRLIEAADPNGPGLTLDFMEYLSLPPGPKDGVERLRKLVVRTLNSYYGIFPGEKGKAPCERDDYESVYGCRPVEIERGVPTFYREFVSGALAERDAVTILWNALNYAADHGGLESMPLWLALKSVYPEA